MVVTASWTTRAIAKRVATTDRRPASTRDTSSRSFTRRERRAHPRGPWRDGEPHDHGGDVHKRTEQHAPGRAVQRAEARACKRRYDDANRIGNRAADEQERQTLKAIPGER